MPKVAQCEYLFILMYNHKHRMVLYPNTSVTCLLYVYCSLSQVVSMLGASIRRGRKSDRNRSNVRCFLMLQSALRVFQSQLGES